MTTGQLSKPSALALALLLVVAVPAVPRVPATTHTFDRGQIEIERFETERGEAFDRIAMPGLRQISTPGAPSLPVEVVRFVIPGDARVDGVVVTGLGEEELPGTWRIVPAQVEVPIGEEAPWTDPDPAIYGSDAPYPESRVVYLGDGYLGGYHIASVAIYPLQYRPSSGRVTLATEVSLELSLSAGRDRSLARGRVTERSDELYRRLVSGLVENPEDVERKAGTEVVPFSELGPEGFLPRYTPSLEGSPVEYVIITSDEFQPYFQDLADWKTQKGVPAAIRTVSWIESNYPGGCDTAERIRMFIQDAYSTWGTTYVLLGGDTNVVPTRYAWTTYYGGWSISTDLYYSDLDGNWNGDGDDAFGEGYGGFYAPGDSLDLYPDVFVGRAPTATSVEVETFVSKTLTYEKDVDPIFADRNLYLAEVLFPYDWEPGDVISSDGAGDVVEPSLAYLPPWIRAVRLYQNYTPYPGSYPLSREAAIDSINVGYNITSHVGHGNKDVLRTSKDQYITMQDIAALTNGEDRSGFFWMLDCTSTAIEYDCISERIMNNPNGGASLLFGPTRFCFPTTAKDYYHSWFERLYTEGMTRAGVICAGCKTPYVSLAAYDNTDRWTQMSFLLLGDPEVRIFTDRPRPLTVSYTHVIELGPADMTITVTDPAAVDSALVCIAKEDEVYAAGYTNASGQVELSFTPQTTGAMTITVTHPNHFPYEDTIGVTSTTGAHLTLGSTTVDDDGTGASDGNANGRAEAGETIELGISVGNGGQGDAAAVTAALTTTDPYVVLSDSTEFLGDISGGSVPEYDAAFSFTVADSCPNEHDASFSITFADSSRSTWTSAFVLRFYRPILVQHLNDVDDGPGGDGVPDVGENIVLTIEILNDGNGDADMVSGLLRYPSAEVTITDSTDSWGDIPAGTVVNGQDGFEFTVDAAITGLFELELSDEDGKRWTLHFDLAGPGMPDSLRGTVAGTTISLAWDPLDDPDLWGYNIYRKDYLIGTYNRVNDAVIEGSARYEDSDLEEKHLYYYEVAGVDSSGNEGPRSATLEISTNPPSQDGWPLMGGESMYGTPAIADIDLDGDLELLVGSGDVYCWHHNGIEYHDGDGDPRTNGIYNNDGFGGYRASLAIGEMDGDEYPEVVGCAWGNVGTEEDPVYEIFAWNAEDASILAGWPVVTPRFCWATPALADLDHDGLSEIIVCCADGYMYCWKPDGTEFIDGDNDPATDGVFAYLGATWNYGSPAVVDLDGDHDLEIVQASRSDSVYAFNPDGTRVPGWPVSLRGDSECSVAVGDLDRDGDIEVVAASNIDSIWVFDATGAPLAGWPKFVELRGDFPPSPTLADVDGDGDLEIVQVDSDGGVHIWTWEGNVVPGWPQAMDATSHSSAAVGDIDGDAGMEIVTACNGGKLYAYDTDGQILDGWPIQTGAEIYSTATLVDLDLDGDVEVVASGMDAYVYVWDCEGNYADGAGVEWATFRANFTRNGLYDYKIPVGVPDGGDRPIEHVTLEQNFPNPFNPVTTITFSIPEGVSSLDLAVYDVAGRRVATLLDSPVEPGRRSVAWDGRDAGGRPVSSGIYFLRLAADGETQIRKVVLVK